MAFAPTALGGTLKGVSFGYGAPFLGGLVIDAATAATATINAAGTLTLTPGVYAPADIVLDPTISGGVAVLQGGAAGTVTLAPTSVVTIAESAAAISNPLPALSVGLFGTLLNEGIIQGQYGYAATAEIQIGGGPFTNRGLIALQAATLTEQAVTGSGANRTTVTYHPGFAPTLDIASPDFTNIGTIDLAGGTLALTGGTVSNQGLIALSDAATQYSDGSTGSLSNRLVVGAAVTSFDNLGTITAGTVEFDNAVALAALGSLNAQLDIVGTLDLGGGTLDASQYGTVHINGTVRDGTLKSGTGVLDILTTQSLDAVTVDQGGSVTVYGPNTLEGIPAGAAQVTLDAATVRLDFAAPTTITGVAITAGGAGMTDTLSVASGTVTLDAASSLTLLGGTLDVAGAGTLANDGAITVQAGTLALAAALDGGGALAVAAGASVVASGAIGGTQAITLAAGAVMNAATLTGGAVTLGNAAQMTATLLDGGSVTVGQDATLVAGTLGGNAVITLDAGSTATIEGLSGTPTVDFAGGAALLVLPGTGTLPVTLVGVQPSDLIDFQAVSAIPSGLSGAGGAATSGNTLLVTGASGQTAQTSFTDPQGYLSFTTTIDGGGTLVTALACFRAGTRIATARGQMPVERLRAGDLIRTAAGRFRPVIWLGSRRIDCRGHPCPQDVWPVRVQAHAFAPGRPARDLFLSPDHAVRIGAGLVPVRYLLNGASIAQLPAAEVEYWHVELPAHDVLLAENLPAESFLDVGNRDAFAGGAALAGAAALRLWRVRGCAPLLAGGPAVAAAHARLLARAKRLGHRLSAAAGLRVMADGRPVARRGGLFALQPGVRTIRLQSRRFVPAQLGGVGHDPRPLGVAVAGLRLDADPVALDDARLTAGWYPPEPGWRWTAGDGVIAAQGARALAIEPRHHRPLLALKPSGATGRGTAIQTQIQLPSSSAAVTRNTQRSPSVAATTPPVSGPSELPRNVAEAVSP